MARHVWCTFQEAQLLDKGKADVVVAFGYGRVDNQLLLKEGGRYIEQMRVKHGPYWTRL